MWVFRHKAITKRLFDRELVGGEHVISLPSSSSQVLGFEQKKQRYINEAFDSVSTLYGSSLQ